MTKKLFFASEIEDQRVYQNEHWSVIFPRKPLSPFHLMFVSNNENKKLFTDLDDEQLVSLKDCINYITSKIAAKYGNDFDGYNLFSNNGSLRIGQHMDHFHEHIFIRLVSEKESPYVTMARRETWFTQETEEWREQRQKLENIFKTTSNINE